jgi:predicted small integral membrane protein
MASINTLESGLFRSYWDDGLLDLLAGLGVIGVAVFWAVDLVAIGAVVPAVLATLWVPLRRALVDPRIGLVEFSETRMNRMRGLSLGTAVLGVAMLLIVGIHVASGSRSSALVEDLAPAIPALLLGLMAAVGGWAIGLPRFLGYAAVLGLAGLAVAIADARPEMAMLAGGAAPLVGGIRRLRHLLRLPVESGEDA